MKNIWIKKSKRTAAFEAIRKKSTGIYEKWQDRLPDSNGEDKNRALSIILENQEIFNEISDGSSLMERSLDIVQDVWSNTILWDLISIQPMIQPCGTIHYRKSLPEGDYHSEEVIAKTRKCKSRLCFASNYNGYCSVEDFKREATIVITKEFTLEMEREVIADLRNNAGTVCRCKNFEEGIQDLFDSMSIKISRYFDENKTPNWMITSPEIAEKNGIRNANEIGTLGIKKADGLYLGMKVFIDPLFPSGGFLIGYKGDIFESSYSYNPYVSMTPTPVFPDPSQFCPRPGLLTRYSKKMTKGGNALYGSGLVKQ